jgi:uridine kinase
MKAALIISGYLRSFELNIGNIKSKIIGKFDTVDVYIHITKNEENDDKYLNYNEKLITTLINQFNPLILHEPNYLIDNDKKTNDVKNCWLKFYKLNSLKNLNESIKNYDLIIKYRPDLNIISDNIFNESKKGIVYIPKDSKIDIGKLKNKDDKYLCDIFAYGSSDIMNRYFDIYNHLDKLIEKYGNVPETLLYHYLNDNNIKYELIDIDYNVILSKCNVFSITGDSGSGKSSLANILKKYFSNSFLLECDRYHKWERGDDNWNNYTHLNPDANFIAKMNSDIFDLKIGKKIYHVDYDHSTGKFTDKQIIESNDNIIVCGLHSLYTNNDNVYDLKIYIDTQEELKNFWKINRDTKERGYTLEKSLKQIENRREDYYRFIYPQREKSDLIINFYHKNLENFDVNNKDLCLKIYIKQNFDINSIIELFKTIGLNLHIKLENNFFVFDFEKYEDLDISSFFNIPKLNNFYDYIILIIIHMKKSVLQNFLN